MSRNFHIFGVRKWILCSEARQGNAEPFQLSENPQKRDVAGAVKIVKATYVSGILDAHYLMFTLCKEGCIIPSTGDGEPEVRRAAKRRLGGERQSLGLDVQPSQDGRGSSPGSPQPPLCNPGLLSLTSPGKGPQRSPFLILLCITGERLYHRLWWRQENKLGFSKLTFSIAFND